MTHETLQKENECNSPLLWSPLDLGDHKNSLNESNITHNYGIWSIEEVNLLRRSLFHYGCNYIKLAQSITTKTLKQIEAHSLSYIYKLQAKLNYNVNNSELIQPNNKEIDQLSMDYIYLYNI